MISSNYYNYIISIIYLNRFTCFQVYRANRKDFQTDLLDETLIYTTILGQSRHSQFRVRVKNRLLMPHHWIQLSFSLHSFRGNVLPLGCGYIEMLTDMSVEVKHFMVVSIRKYSVQFLLKNNNFIVNLKKWWIQVKFGLVGFYGIPIIVVNNIRNPVYKYRVSQYTCYCQ